MSAQHTPGAIRYDYEPGYCGELIASNGTTIATFPPVDEADARRLVACWNACEGITDPENVVPRLLALNELVPDLENQAATLRVQRDELLAALKKARSGLSNGLWDYGPGQDEHTQCNALIEEIDAAIAKVTGEQT